MGFPAALFSKLEVPCLTFLFLYCRCGGSPQDKLLPLKMGSLERLFGIILLIQLLQSRACSAETVPGRFSNLFLNKTLLLSAI